MINRTARFLEDMAQEDRDEKIAVLADRYLESFAALKTDFAAINLGGCRDDESVEDRLGSKDKRVREASKALLQAILELAGAQAHPDRTILWVHPTRRIGFAVMSELHPLIGESRESVTPEAERIEVCYPVG